MLIQGIVLKEKLGIYNINVIVSIDTDKMIEMVGYGS